MGATAGQYRDEERPAKARAKPGTNRGPNAGQKPKSVIYSVRIKSDLHERMQAYPKVDWGSIARDAIESFLSELDGKQPLSHDAAMLAVTLAGIQDACEPAVDYLRELQRERRKGK